MEIVFRHFCKGGIFSNKRFAFLYDISFLKMRLLRVAISFLKEYILLRRGQDFNRVNARENVLEF